MRMETSDIQTIPNPSSGIFSVFFLKNTESANSFKVFDFSGRRIVNKNLSGSSIFHIDLSDKSKGIYYVRVHSTGGTLYKKITLL